MVSLTDLETQLLLPAKSPMYRKEAACRIGQVSTTQQHWGRRSNWSMQPTRSSHPSLHFKKVGMFWSSRVGLHYRALAIEAEQDLVWFWIGSHAEYDKLVGRKPANRPLQPTSRARKNRPPSKRRSRASRG